MEKLDMIEKKYAPELKNSFGKCYSPYSLLYLSLALASNEQRCSSFIQVVVEVVASSLILHTY